MGLPPCRQEKVSKKLDLRMVALHLAEVLPTSATFKYMCTHMLPMATKTITVTEDAYEHMKKLKHQEESFSTLFLRLADEKLRVADIYGLLSRQEQTAGDWIKQSTAVRKGLSSSLQDRGKHVHT